MVSFLMVANDLRKRITGQLGARGAIHGPLRGLLKCALLFDDGLNNRLHPETMM